MSRAEFARELLDLLGRSVPFNERPETEVEDELPEAGLPTAVLVVVEWQSTPGGERWLSRLALLGSGQEAPRWTGEMLAREAGGDWR